MARNRSTRLREYELLEQRARQRRTYDQQTEDGQYLDRPARPLADNTLDAPDDYMARRRNSRHRVVMASRSSGSGNPVMENVLILVLLIFSIYGLYRLSLYLLSQAS